MWYVSISLDLDDFPEKVATAVSNLKDSLIGAEYKPYAYLGSQESNGINHAVLAEQTIITGKDAKNVVILIFNEKPNSLDIALSNIERVVESGGPTGGININMTKDIPEDAENALNAVSGSFVGARILPFMYLGSQVVKGINHIFAAEIIPIDEPSRKRVALVIANEMTGDLALYDMLGDKFDTMSLGYAFTWLKRSNTSLGAPLGEWP